MAAKLRVSGTLLIGTLLLTTNLNSAAQSDPPLRCEVGGFGGKQLVPDVATASAIYEAVIEAVWPENLKRFPRIRAIDEGDHWSLTDELPTQNSRLPPLIRAGGGEFSMDIDKCTGAISHAQGNR